MEPILAGSRNPDNLIQQRIARFARDFPDRLAIHTSAEMLSYAELDSRSNVIAMALIERGVQTGECIALLCPPVGAEAIGMLGILKTGAIVVPINPSHPDHRSRLILADSQTRLLLYDRQYKAVAHRLVDGQISCLDWRSLIPRDGSPGALPTVAPEAAAVLKYSSGSTGTPKGILHTHRSTLDLGWVACSRNLHAADKVLVCGKTLAFNRTILQGACSSPWLVLEQSMPSLPTWIQTYQPTVLLTGPSTLRLLAQTLANALSASSLRRVVLTGEPLYRHDLALFRSALPATCVLVNELGSNETKTYAQYVIDAKTVIHDHIVPVGRALPGKRVRILDEQGRDCETGEIGEIVVSMPSLSSGYWRQAELTRASFLAAKDGSDWGTYRTGDRGRWNPAGLLVYCGRQDWQCKINGQKVELMEVEATLSNLSGIEEAAVIASERQGSMELIAYYVLRSGHCDAASVLRQQLLQTLPGFMVPGRWVQLERMPRTATGKIARLKLPSVPTACIAEHGSTHEAEASQTVRGPLPPPGSSDGALELPHASAELENQLKRLWAEVLGHGDFGIGDHFFMVGGDSLSAARLVAMIASHLDRLMPVAAVFQAPSIQEQAVWLTMQSAQVPPGLSGQSLPVHMLGSPNLVVLQPQGSRPPLFVVHGWGGKLHHFIGLARALAPERPVLGLQPDVVGDAAPDLPGVRAMAAAYAEQILKRQPEGPIHLLGNSAGGWYAHAVACELLARGARLGMFGLLDSRVSTRIHRRLGVVLLLQRGMRQIRAGWRARHDLIRSRSSDQLLLDGVRRLNLWLYRYLNLYLARPGRKPREDPFVALLKRDYRPTRPAIVADLFAPASLLPELRRLWSFYARGGVRCHPMFSKHDDFRRPELMPTLAARLEAVLQQLESETATGRSC